MLAKQKGVLSVVLKNEGAEKTYFFFSFFTFIQFQVHQSLSLNSAMDFVSRGENSTVSPLVRSPLINDTFQKLLDSATESSTDESGSRDLLIEKLVEEIVAKESGRLDFVTKIRPDLHQAILDITAHYGWRNVIYLFHSNEGVLLERLID